jgi:site-specific recombinase XerD
VVQADYKKALSKCLTARDTALVEVLWSTGMRREEIAQHQRTVDHELSHCLPKHGWR